MKKHAGFTLMELMVVIAIIGILSAIAIPNVISWRNNAQVNAAARGLYSDLQSARSMAVKENGISEVTFSTSGSGSYTISLPNGTDRTVNVSQHGAVSVKSVTFTDTAAAGPIIFTPTGFPFRDGVLSGVTVVLSGAIDRQVVLTPAGNVSIGTS